MNPIEVALLFLCLHGLLGAFDTFYNHEWREHLANRPSAGPELSTHSLRSILFTITFAGLAWFEWHGVWGWAILVIIAFEYLVTIVDSIIEDRTRSLSAVERATHMVLGLNTGLYTAFVGIQVAATWRHQPSALVATHYAYFSWLLTLFAIATAAWAVRDGVAAFRPRTISKLAAS